jgi:hypothetical protein
MSQREQVRRICAWNRRLSREVKALRARVAELETAAARQSLELEVADTLCAAATREALSARQP